jgi:hypothetical protein
MNKIYTKSLFKENIKAIWENEEFRENEVLKEVIKRGVVLQNEMSTNSILFVGINPSFNIGKGVSNNNFNEINDGFYNNTDGHIDKNPYFRKFIDISDKLKLDWAHTDLLFFRETNQKYVNLLLKKATGKKFIQAQLQISKQIIIQSKPKVIIVSNSLARDIMGTAKDHYMGFEIVFDSEMGTHKIINQVELENIPIFFTSMLTGQRALDKGSYARLIWHIKYALRLS